MFTVPVWIFLKMTELQRHEELLAPEPESGPIWAIGCGDYLMDGIYFWFFFAAGFLIFWGVPGLMLSCLSAFLLFCFSVFLLLCFSACLLLCFSAFLLLCFSACLLLCFSASLLFCFLPFLLFAFSAFHASLLYLLLSNESLKKLSRNPY